MKLAELFEEVVAKILDERSTDLDGLLVIYLLHTHLVQLRPGAVLEDVQSGGLLGSLTKSDAAEMVGKRIGRVGRNTEEYWLRQYSLRTPYEFHDELPTSLREHVGGLRRRAAEHPFVAELIPGEG